MYLASDSSRWVSRSFIRYLVETQLMADAQGREIYSIVQRADGTTDKRRVVPDPTSGQEFDRQTLDEVLSICFSDKKHPALYQEQATVLQARNLEQQIAQDAITLYREIKRRKSDPLVQKLNGLL